VPEVSVILPTCDRPDLVGRALASLLGQTFADFEILLIDANRRSPPVAENPRLTEVLHDARVSVIDGHQTRNAAMSRNLGLQAARGAWITFLDDDDEYRPTKIAEQHACALARRSPLALCGYEFVWPRRRRIRQVDREVFRGDELITRAAFNTPLLFHRREETLRFDERLSTGDDVIYALQIIFRHGLSEVPCVPRALVVVHPQPAAQSAHGDKEAAWRGCQATWRLAHSHFSRPARRALLAHGRLERATGGYGTALHFLRCIVAVMRTRGLREWRLVLYSILTRRRRR
jgi:glycosyltransferase involved in cell wall biosynthesis